MLAPPNPGHHQLPPNWSSTSRTTFDRHHLGSRVLGWTDEFPCIFHSFWWSEDIRGPTELVPCPKGVEILASKACHRGMNGLVRSDSFIETACPTTGRAVTASLKSWFEADFLLVHPVKVEIVPVFLGISLQFCFPPYA